MKNKNMKIMKRIILLQIIILFITFTLNASPRRVLLEFTTSNTCEYCGCLDSLLKSSTMIQYPQTVILAMHGTIRPPADPYSIYFGSTIRDSLIGPEVGFSAPMSFIDRSFWSYVDYMRYRDSLNYRYTTSPVSPVELTVASKVYNPVTRMLTVTINAKAEQTLTGDYRINFVISENNLISFQAGGPCNEQSFNFDHDWVIRTMANGYDGELLINGTWNQNQVISRTFSYQVDSAWVAENSEYNVYVYKRLSLLRHSEVQQATKGPVTGSIGINNTGAEVRGYGLWQNYPNPFNPVTNIKFSIPRNESVKIVLYNSLGNEAAVFFSGRLNAGIYNLQVDMSSFGSGAYYCKMETKGFSETKKLMLVK